MRYADGHGSLLGTVITIHQDTRLDLTAPITERLRQRDTGLRSTADASLLVESLLDLGRCRVLLEDVTVLAAWY